MNTNRLESSFQWNEREFGTSPVPVLAIPPGPKATSVVTRADFGQRIDDINALTRQVVNSYLASHAIEHGTPVLDEDHLKHLESTALQYAFYRGRFKTQYGEVTEYFYPTYLRIVDPKNDTAEPHDRVKIIWSTLTKEKTEPFDIYSMLRGKLSSELTPTEVLEELHCVSHKGNNEIISAKLVQRHDVGFVVCRLDTGEEGGLQGADFFNLEEATALEQQAQPGEKIDWLQHSAYRALKMLIS